jgi:hypothetical protein
VSHLGHMSVFLPKSAQMSDLSRESQRSRNERMMTDLRRSIGEDTGNPVDKDDQANKGSRNEHLIVETAESEIERHFLAHVRTNQRQRLKLETSTHRRPMFLQFLFNEHVDLPLSPSCTHFTIVQGLIIHTREVVS